MPAPNQPQATTANPTPRQGAPSSHDLLPAEALNTKEYLESAVMPVVTQALKQLAQDRYVSLMFDLDHLNS